MAARDEDDAPPPASASPLAEEHKVSGLNPGDLLTIREALEIMPVSRSLL